MDYHALSCKNCVEKENHDVVRAYKIVKKKGRPKGTKNTKKQNRNFIYNRVKEINI